MEQTEAMNRATALDLRLKPFVPEEKLMTTGHELHEGFTCPLCCMPMALPMKGHAMLKTCCMKIVCDGCMKAKALERGAVSRDTGRAWCRMHGMRASRRI